MILLALWTIFIVYIISPFLNYKGAWWLTIHVWAPGIAIILLSTIKIEGKEHIRSNAHYIFMANHASYFDIACLFYASKRPLHFIAKEELSRNFFTGYMLRKLKIIFVDRKNSQRATASMEQAVNHIAKGIDVAIFPEGTRTKTGKLGTFKKGGFKLAAMSNTPIMPVAIKNSQIAWPRKNFGFRPATVTVTFFPEISLDTFTADDLPQITEKTKQLIVQSLY